MPVLLSATIERCNVSIMQDFYYGIILYKAFSNALSNLTVLDKIYNFRKNSFFCVVKVSVLATAPKQSDWLKSDGNVRRLISN